MNRTKLEISEAVQQVLDGNENPLEIYAIFKDLQKHLDNALKEIQDNVQDEAEKYEKNFTLGNYIFERRAGRKIMSYKKIEEWAKIDKERKEIEAKAKLGYSMYEKGLDAFNPETGEVLPLPEVSYSKDVLIVKTKS